MGTNAHRLKTMIHWVLEYKNTGIQDVTDADVNNGFHGLADAVFVHPAWLIREIVKSVVLKFLVLRVKSVVLILIV